MYPGALPPAGTAVSTNTLAAAGHTALHNNDRNEIRALASKMGTGASTPTSGLLLRGNGVGTSAWSQVALTTDVSGVLPAASGGTGTSTELLSLSSGNVLKINQLRYKNNTADSTETGVTIQFGWGFVAGDGDAFVTEAVTLPTAFATILAVSSCALGTKTGSDPSSQGDFIVNTVTADAQVITNTGFTMVVANTNGTAMNSTVRVGYSWVAIGILS